ncbi:MAG: exonuclease SbcCD subunit D [Lachnospiraceae bacterium]|nr:exonuclease SbcCD subunit D [Lachnospiraceae bacterium]
MKIMHISDLHIGKSLRGFDLIEDQKYILNQIVEMTEEESVDAILIAGDVYDKSIPSEAATNLLDSFLSQLSEKKKSVYMISGNHDSEYRLNYGKSFFEKNNVYISAVYNGKIEKYVINDDDVEVNIYLLPFVKASQVKHFFPDSKIETYEDAVRVTIENTDIDETKKNILVAHQYVIGDSIDPIMGGSESMGTQYVGTVERIGYDVFDKFDYVALGHIHSSQGIGRDEVRYAGTPLKYSLKEIDNEKSVTLITIDDNPGVKIEMVPLKPIRDMRHIKGELEDLLKESNVHDVNDYIYVTITNEEIIDDAMGIFQQIYPNTVEINYENSHTQEVEQVDISQISTERPFNELIEDFYKTIYGCDISKEEMDVMEEVAREAGVINEAN